MYDKMFKATGGARMGMRARASQNGKLARTEGGHGGAGDVGTPGDNVTKDAVKDEPMDETRSPMGATDEEVEGPASRKRRRAARADAGKDAKEQSSVAEGVEVKSEKSRVVVKKERKSGDKNCLLYTSPSPRD